MQFRDRSVQRDRIVIIGAGFGGFQAAQSLAGAAAEVLLIDRNNYHTFVPLLYQVATAQLEPSLVAYPVRTKLRKMQNVRFLQAEVQRIDFHNKLVDLGNNLISYDYLVVATGATFHDYGVAGIAENAFTLQSLNDALRLRNQVLRCCEQAAFATDDRERQRLMTFAIAGGGATGVELAGALAEWLQGAIRRDFPELTKWGRVVLLQGGASLLPEFPQRLGNYTHRQLEHLGVQVRLNTQVTACSSSDVSLSDGDEIATATVIWAAGVTANPPPMAEPIHQQTKGKLAVRETLQLIEHDHVYAIGDVAYFEQSGEALTGVAPEALQQGVAVARNLRRQLAEDSPRPFRYFNKGRLAIVGGYGGVGSVCGINFGGWLPWLMWLVVHVVYLPGYRSRLFVLLTWVQNYILGDRALRHLAAQSSIQS